MSTNCKNAIITPLPLKKNIPIYKLIDEHFSAYNAARLREAAQLWSLRMAKSNVTIGLTISGALTPAGLGPSCLVPLVKHNLIDFIISTGANLYHDAHFALGFKLHRSSPHVDDRQLRADKIVRIYDIAIDFEVLAKTDAFFCKIMEAPEFNNPMSSAKFHYLVGRYLAERQRILGLEETSLLAICAEMEVPIYTSSPGDSTIGMIAAVMALKGSNFSWDVNQDVNETAALIHLAKVQGEKTGVIILGGGSPKNFILQTEPYLQEALFIKSKGHDYFLQITDARADTGGLSGATPSEAVSWKKIDPEGLPHSVVCYTDITIALPMLTAYLLETCEARQPKRLLTHRDKAMALLKRDAVLD